MKRNLLNICLAVVFFVLGCFGSTWVRSAFFNQDLAESNDSSGLTVEKLDDTLLPPKREGFVVSNGDTDVDGFLAKTVTLSLDEIVLIEEIDIYLGLIREFFGSLPLVDIPDALIALSEKTIPWDHHMNGWYIKEIGLTQGVSLFFERDFESAKKFAMDYISKERRPDSLESENPLTSVLRSTLFQKWMKKDKGACLKFILEENDSGREVYGRLFVSSCMKDYPAEVYAFCEKHPEFLDKTKNGYSDYNINGYRKLFNDWYVKDPTVALEKALSLNDANERKLALSGILKTMSKEHPDTAIGLIEKEFKEDVNYKFYLIDSMFQYAQQEDKRAALDFIQQSNFSEEQKTLFYQGFSKAMSADDLNAFLNSHEQLLSEDDIRLLVKSKFLGHELFVEKYEGNTHSYDYGQSMSDSPESLAILMTRLNVEEKQTIISDIFNDYYTGGRYQNGSWILDMYKDIPDEKINRSQTLRILERVMWNDLQRTADFFVKRIHGNNQLDLIENNEIKRKDGHSITLSPFSEKELFLRIVDTYVDRDKAGAKLFIDSLEDPKLQEQARIAMYIKDWKGNGTDAVRYFESMDDEQLGKLALQQIARQASENDPQSLIPILSSISKADWMEEVINDSSWMINRVSEDTVLDFIDGLSGHEKVQSVVQGKFYQQNLYMNPKLSLEIALGMPSSEENDKRIRDAWERFRSTRPKTADRWAKENNLNITE